MESDPRYLREDRAFLTYARCVKSRAESVSFAQKPNSSAAVTFQFIFRVPAAVRCNENKGTPIRNRPHRHIRAFQQKMIG